MQDAQLMPMKRQIVSKVQDVLEAMRTRLKEALKQEPLPEVVQPLRYGKISRGENYHQQPYLVLDFPAVLEQEDVFLFRTMFWWGHYWSSHFLLQGEFLQHFGEHVFERKDELKGNWTLQTQGDPWEHRLGEMVPIKQASPVKDPEFMKLSRKWPLSTTPAAAEAESLESWRQVQALLR